MSKLPRARIALLAALIVLPAVAPVHAEADTVSSAFVADADAHVAPANPNTNYGNTSAIQTDNAPVAESYVRFTVTGVTGTVTGARLRLYVTNASSDGPAVYATDSTQTWTETGITWNNRVARTGGAIADVGAVRTGTWVEYDVKAGVPGNGTFTFNLATPSGDGTDFSSRQASANRPQLVVEASTSDPLPPGGTSPTFAPEADARVVQGSPNANFGTLSSLEADASPVVESYLRFPVSGLTGYVTRARLRLFVTEKSVNGPALYLAGNEWSETGITWANRPARLGGAVANRGSVPSGAYVEYDVPPASITNAPVTFALVADSTDGMDANSREAASNRPQLVVETSDVAPPPPPPPPPPGSSKPNFVIFLTDDQRARDTMQVMPKTLSWFADGGATFPNGFATTPLCCPDRSGLFSGRYTHNHGNLNNQDTDNLDYDATFQKYLQDAGYQTGIVGKFLMNWDMSKPPPNFDYWALTSGGYFDVTYHTDQGSVKADYTTSETRRQALRMIDAFERDDSRPFVLYIAPQAPHEPWQPEPAYANANVGTWDGNPAVFETDRSDKPSWVQSSHKTLADGRGIRQNQLRTLMSVDDMVDTVMRRLTDVGEESNTMSVFTSDNAYQWGEHGLVSKYHPYSESVMVPFMVRWPGRIPGRVVDNRNVGNVDIAPSMLIAAGVSPALKYPLDGRPFLSATGLSTEGRAEEYLEYFVDANRSIPDWASLRTTTYQYIEYSSSGSIVFREYYDLVHDPEQLVNLFRDGVSTNDPDVSTLSSRLAVYRHCAGTTGPTACA